MMLGTAKGILQDLIAELWPGQRLRLRGKTHMHSAYKTLAAGCAAPQNGHI